VALGSMVFEFSTTGIARIAAEAGADFLVFDMEHTGWSMETIRHLMATSRPADLVPIVRVPATQYHFLARALDVGAMGLMVPMVETEEQARVIVESSKYPPLGQRGAAFGVAHDDYKGGDLLEKMRSANEELLLIALLETPAGIENAAKIAALDGIDVLWIGQFDLTKSMGIPGQFTHPDFLKAVDRVLAACRRQGKAAAYMASSPEEGLKLLQQGFRCLAYLGDLWIYKQGLEAGIRAIRAGWHESSERKAR
jgi:2-dehydro-3-deoxyglucarate aldolase/4-hydroxy-2-oxoheptanedioate aldolase